MSPDGHGAMTALPKTCIGTTPFSIEAFESHQKPGSFCSALNEMFEAPNFVCLHKRCTSVIIWGEVGKDFGLLGVLFEPRHELEFAKASILGMNMCARNISINHMVSVAQ
ncbi:hypothetical protein DUNSADRAFT_10826 [Dunaliella salina]|uniref:Uncharacterized protein n=1 Tax=Dunaliella salina TaxID=3046 RepID=A0ABQ7H9W9_DUNSA|nr:hypothetical protein DUNSADRAFT_10826 [Dunaliella salina]|eukprot:KAF5843651.1 hypothetical protein DUNSADRAFT_10826 [Dunaliella salina]